MVTSEGGADAIKSMAVPDANQGELDDNSETYRYRNAQAALKLTEAYDKNLATIAAQDEAIKRLTKVKNDDAAKAEKNQSEITQGTTDLTADQKAFTQKKAGDEIQTAIGFARTAEAGGQLNASQQAYERTIATMIAGQNVNTQQAEKMLQLASRNKDTLDSFLERLFQAINKIPNFALYESRLSYLERNLNALGNRARESERRASQSNF